MHRAGSKRNKTSKAEESLPDKSHNEFSTYPWMPPPLPDLIPKGSTVAGSLANKSPYAWMSRLADGSEECLKLKYDLYSCIGPLPCQYSIVDVYRKQLSYDGNDCEHLVMFKLFEKAMAAKRNGNANMVPACLAVNRADFNQIMTDGFVPLAATPKIADVCDLRGFSLCLYPLNFTSKCLLTWNLDFDGLRRLVFCHVILGRTESVPAGLQLGPSSIHFDSGVDEQKLPQMYVVWYPDVKTNVLPVAAISVKMRSIPPVSCREPKEQLTWKMSADLVHVLSGVLPQSSLPVIWRLRLDFLEKKINEEKFLSSIWEVLGDKTSEAGNLLKKDNILKMLFQDEDAAAAAKFVAHLNDASGEARKVEHSGIQREVKREVDNGDFPPGGFGDVNGSRQQCAEDLDKYAKSLELKLEETGEPLV